MKKKLIAAFLIFSVSLSSYSAAFATTASDLKKQQQKLAEQQKELKNNSAKLAQVQKERTALEISIEELDSKIEKIIIKINDNKKDIATNQVKIEVLKGQLNDAESDLVAEKALLDKRLKAMYVNGASGYLQILLEAKGISDFLVRFENVIKIINRDKEIVAEINSKKKDISTKKVELDAVNAVLVALKADNVKAMNNLDATRNKQEGLIEQLDAKEELLQSIITDESKKISDTTAMIKKLQKDLANSNSGGTTNYSTNAIVAYASTFIGSPYIWGGNGEILTPSYMEQIISVYGSRYPRSYLEKFIGLRTFDCSGFVTFVFKHFGVYFKGSRPYTGTMINEGTPVAKSNLEAGDVVYFGTNGSVNHVGIYVGNGCFIEAPRSLKEVRISVLAYRTDYLTARRMK